MTIAPSAPLRRPPFWRPPFRRPPATYARHAAVAVLALCAAATGPAQDPAAAAPAPLRFVDAASLTVEGRAAAPRAAPFDRLPATAQGVVRAPVWELSRHSAGIVVRFHTDAARIALRYRLTSERLAMPHMPASGVSGFDLYVEHEGRLRWRRNLQPAAGAQQADLVDDLPAAARPRLCAIYLPLYNGVAELAVGVPEGAALEPAPRAAASRRPVVFYGTSITQGACASRPGMAHVAILGRRLDRPVTNLGFSGQGTLDPEFVALLAATDAAVLVLDCLPNLDADLVAARTAPFVRALREACPGTPIVLVEDRSYAHAPLSAATARRNAERRAALRAALAELRAAGVGGLHHVPGDDLLGADGEATVDGSHPTDLGFVRQADALEPVLRAALGD